MRDETFSPNEFSTPAAAACCNGSACRHHDPNPFITLFIGKEMIVNEEIYSLFFQQLPEGGYTNKMQFDKLKSAFSNKYYVRKETLNLLLRGSFPTAKQVPVLPAALAPPASVSIDSETAFHAGIIFVCCLLTRRCPLSPWRSYWRISLRGASEGHHLCWEW